MIFNNDDFSAWWGLFMSVVYIGIAWLVAFRFQSLLTQPFMRNFLAVVLVLYGIFRAWRAIQKLKEIRKDE
jgi:uncharacterized membrane protein HdeD (DUF308 family)